MNPLTPSTMNRARTAIAVAWTTIALVSMHTAHAQVSTAWSEPTRGVSIAVDSANNVFTVDYEQQLGAEMVVTKRDVNGNLLWQASQDQTVSTQWERAQWIATDSQGNAIVCGTLMSGFSNPVTFGSIVMKVSKDGDVLWRNVIANGADGGTKKCVIGPDDDIYVLGLGSGPPGYVTRVQRFTPAGALVWSYFDAVGIGAPINIKFTPDHALVIAGRGIFGSVNGYAKIDLNGNPIWSLGGVQSLTVGDVAGDSQGNSYVVHGDFVLNGGTRIKKLSPTGSILFDQVYGLSAFRIEIGTDDRAVACGFPNQNQGGAAFIKIDQAGNLVWSNLDADGPSFALLLHAQLQLDESNDAYLAAGTLFAMAICKINSDGTSAWTQTASGGSASGFALSQNDDSLFVVGGLATARFVDAAEGPWHDLGRGLAGANGIPLFYGAGSMVAGQPLALTITDAAPNAIAALVLGASEIDLPAFGGTWIPSPDVVITGLVTDANGDWQLATTMPAGLPAGVDITFQAWIADVGAPANFAATNGVRATTP